MSTSRRPSAVYNLPASSDVTPAAFSESPAVPVSHVAPSAATAVANSAATAAAASPSSRRKCTVCHQRISPITFDKHYLCSICRKFHCSTSSKCPWSVLEFEQNIFKSSHSR